ncbi:hypothetical protein [Gordonibacter sp. Marseille-P4307]|uniref:hypothetical protein n=1 Tax=Gordonibacter sp. Marseille-P4307 TaxID=2161815 RepID=UPI000F544B46|nr:hypothetical protein [Gordonibacter sp. Marseille-P4307]
MGQHELRCYIAERCADVDSAFARACRIALGVPFRGRRGGCARFQADRRYRGMDAARRQRRGCCW